VFITGSPSPAQLKQLCERLHEGGSYPILIKDAITNFDELKPVLNELNEHQRVNVVVSAQVIDLLKKVGSRYVYAFPKADCTTTVALLFAGGKKVLVIERLRNPFKGFMTLPGGFLNVLLESLPQCAVRELHEEVFSKAAAWLFQPKDLRLVDVRSEPGRDPRGHIVDHGYAWLVPPDREAEIIAAMCKGDDAAKVWLEDTATALKRGLAFDHNELLQAAVDLYGIKLD
jgi:8-oxo-dGTP diphosphatase